MKLTAAEYERGFVRWDSRDPIELQPGVTDDPGTGHEWGALIKDPAGSKVTAPVRRYVGIRIRPLLGRIRLDGLRIRWERVQDNVIKTGVWLGDPRKKPIRLRHLPDLGTFHRLVVAPRFLGWTEDVVLRHGALIVRFVRGRLEIERTRDFDTVKVEPGQFIFEGGAAGTEQADGHLIDIVAPGANEREAELHARAVLGALALGVGDHVIGDVVSSEAYTATDRGQDGFVDIGVRVKVPRTLAPAELDRVDAFLGTLLQTDRLGRARTLSFRWFERGLRAEAPLDRVLSFFIAIETLVSANAKEHAPLPVEQRREPENLKMLEACKALGDAVLERLRNRLYGATIAERFAYFAESHGMADAIQTFRALVKVRNDAVHGDLVDVTREDANKVRDLLVRMLKADVGVAGALDWESHPAIYGMRTHFRFVDSDDTATDSSTA